MTDETQKQDGPDDFASPLAPERDLPVGVAVGGGAYKHPEPDQADTPEEPGEGHDSLAYSKHGDEATTEDGETLRIVVAHPVRVDGTNRRSDDDALEGHKCKIVEGPHEGRKGVFLSTERHDPRSGYPSQVLVRTSDDEHQLLSVPYSHIRPDHSQR